MPPAAMFNPSLAPYERPPSSRLGGVGAGALDHSFTGLACFSHAFLALVHFSHTGS